MNVYPWRCSLDSNATVYRKEIYSKQTRVHEKTKEGYHNHDLYNFSHSQADINTLYFQCIGVRNNHIKLLCVASHSGIDYNTQVDEEASADETEQMKK